MDQLFQEAIPVLEKIEKAGFEAYFVGGAVRDYILNREIADVDIATSATPAEIKSIFPHTVDVGIEHGTVLVLFKGKGYEITTFRAESKYQDFRRPDQVIFIRSLEEDLKRRDFTMNAIAMKIDGELIDPFNGIGSIHRKRIQTVGNSEERLSEDALRMLRAVRFVSQLAFSLDDSCYDSLKKMAPLLDHIAVERKAAEFEKLLSGVNRLNALKLLCETGLDQFLPGLADLDSKVDDVITYKCSELILEEMWALLIHILKIEPQSIEGFLRKWKLPAKKIRKIKQIVHWLQFRLNENWSKSSLYAAGRQMVLYSERVYNVINHQETEQSLSQLAKEYESLPINSPKDLTVSGNDLMDWLNRTPGPWIKECLSLIETAILDEQLINQPNEIKKWVLSCNLN
jgi:tRNA nucleotidyltransferase (CCA-adding enzyme)